MKFSTRVLNLILNEAGSVFSIELAEKFYVEQIELTVDEKAQFLILYAMGAAASSGQRSGAVFFDSIRKELKTRDTSNE